MNLPVLEQGTATVIFMAGATSYAAKRDVKGDIMSHKTSGCLKVGLSSILDPWRQLISSEDRQVFNERRNKFCDQVDIRTLDGHMPQLVALLTLLKFSPAIVVLSPISHGYRARW